MSQNDTPDQRAAGCSFCIGKPSCPICPARIGAARTQPIPPADEPVKMVREKSGLGILFDVAHPVFVPAPETAEPPALSDVARWQWFRERRTTTLLVMMFGNGCVNKTVAMAEAMIDAEIRSFASTPPPEQASTPRCLHGVRHPHECSDCLAEVARMSDDCFSRALNDEQASTPRAEPATNKAPESRLMKAAQALLDAYDRHGRDFNSSRLDELAMGLAEAEKASTLPPSTAPEATPTKGTT